MSDEESFSGVQPLVRTSSFPQWNEHTHTVRRHSQERTLTFVSTGRVVNQKRIGLHTRKIPHSGPSSHQGSEPPLLRYYETVLYLSSGYTGDEERKRERTKGLTGIPLRVRDKQEAPEQKDRKPPSLSCVSRKGVCRVTGPKRFPERE